MNTSEMLHEEELLRLRAKILQREAANLLAKASSLEETRLAEERRQTPITTVTRQTRRDPSERLAAVAAKAFGIPYKEALALSRRFA